MSTIAIGDVHGNLAALDDLLSRITLEISEEDTIVFLGDYIDRGPDPKACIQRIIDFRNTVKGCVVTLLGNHEEWLLRTYEDHTRHSWLLGMEGFQTIRSYSASAAAMLREEAERAGPRLVLERTPLPYEIFFEAVPAEHLTFLTSLQPFCRTPDAVCVHGGLDPAAGRVEEQRTEDLLWGTDEFPERYKGVEFVLYGHANNPVLDDRGWPQPMVVGRTYGLDTISHGVLTALRLPEGTVFQSERHESRASI
jgi:serine/threonine protein phosphatase 1